ncbi:MAG: hemolysin family protein [Planctomycetaceae bacterium]|nr:hemolysin family protein [Planctomycetaceae bacterium]
MTIADPAFWAAAAAAILSGYFALISYTLGSQRRIQLEESFSSARGRRRLAWLEKNLRPLRLTVSLARNLGNLVLMVAVVQLIVPPGGYTLWRLIGAVVAAAGVIAIFGVAIPHALATYSGERVLAATLPVLLACRYLFYPVTAVMSAFDKPIRRLVGSAETTEAENGEAAKQEILQAASEGQAEGAVGAQEVEMIESVMEFAGTRAGQIMTPRTDIFAVPIDMPWAQLVGTIIEAGHTRIPVYQENLDNIVGILYAKDLLQYVVEHQPSDLRSILRKPYFVPETKPLDDLLRDFKARKIHFAVVLDEYGGTAGIVTIEDVVEEIVGEITDEYDQPEPTMMHRIDANTAEVDGRMRVDELNDELDLNLPEDQDYDTIAGMVFAELGYIPAAGEKLESHGARVTVLAADERKITRLKIEALREGSHVKSA